MLAAAAGAGAGAQLFWLPLCPMPAQPGCAAALPGTGPPPGCTPQGATRPGALLALCKVAEPPVHITAREASCKAPTGKPRTSHCPQKPIKWTILKTFQTAGKEAQCSQVILKQVPKPWVVSLTQQCVTHDRQVSVNNTTRFYPFE